MGTPGHNDRTDLFTGLIRETGEVESVHRMSGSLALKIKCAETARDAAPGDSISVNGVCLTATSIAGDSITVDVGEETFRRTTLSGARPGVKVNIEPSLRLGDKVGGHWVLGHVDTVGTVASVKPETTQITYTIRFPRELAPLIAPKGSIAVDGISLTVGAVRGDTFEVYIIPHTAELTTLRDRKPGDPVNLEADVLARYAANAFGGGSRGLLEKLIDHDYVEKKR